MKLLYLGICLVVFSGCVDELDLDRTIKEIQCDVLDIFEDTEAICDMIEGHTSKYCSDLRREHDVYKLERKINDVFKQECKVNSSEDLYYVID